MNPVEVSAAAGWTFGLFTETVARHGLQGGWRWRSEPVTAASLASLGMPTRDHVEADRFRRVQPVNSWWVPMGLFHL